MAKYFNNIVYGVKSFLTGMKLTLDHFNNKKKLVATLQYPHEKWPVPERNIGFKHSDYNLIRSRLHVDIDDCIACMQCERACPVDCIKIDSIKPPKDSEYDCGMTSNDTQKKMIVSRFTIDMSECMYCNLCVYPCPEECIYMVGGPNGTKHEIDYEFSQYKRDGMIFEFADTTDEMIHDAGGEKWLEQRDAKQSHNQEGIELNGVVKIITPADVPVKTETTKKPLQVAEKTDSGELSIQSFNDIADKMCRGISKKAFTSSKRAGKDAVAILAYVAQALSDAGKMTEEIQKILDGLIPAEKSTQEDNIKDTTSDITAKPIEEPISPDTKEMDIKDLNSIEDKMTRGTAKKAFTAAKRSGENKVEAVRKALIEASLIDDVITELLNSFTKDDATADISSSSEVSEMPIEAPTVGTQTDLPLFEIVDLNGIEDKMARGMAKKIYTAGKRSGKTRSEVIADIKSGLSESGKIDESVENVLNNLEAGS